MIKYIIFLLVLLISSCSSEWHLKRAVKKNPHLLDSTIKYVPYQKDTIIYHTVYIKGDTGTQEAKRIVDSLQRVYNDSFTTVLQLVDSLGNLKTTVIRKPYAVHDSILVTIRDTIKVLVPSGVTIEEESTNWPLILGLIAVILFLLMVFLKR